MTRFMSADPNGRRGGGVRARRVLTAVLLFLPALGGWDGAGGATPAVSPPPTPIRVAAAPPAPAARPFERTLAGLGTRETAALLGTPSATEDRAPARVWRYDREGCALRVFFFMDMTSHAFRALSFDMTTTQEARDDNEQCFAALLERDRFGHGLSYRTGAE
jgi:hypothetical protein